MSFLCEEYIIIFVSREDLLRNSRLLCFYVFVFGGKENEEEER
jgi:hypothetical protein